jgi:hypothetical protein
MNQKSSLREVPQLVSGVLTGNTYVPLSFAPGDAYQFERSHEVVALTA